MFVTGCICVSENTAILQNIWLVSCLCYGLEMTSVYIMPQNSVRWHNPLQVTISMVITNTVLTETATIAMGIIDMASIDTVITNMATISMDMTDIVYIVTTHSQLLGM